MDFFKKTWVKITGWVLLILGTAILIIGGVTQEEVNKGVTLTIGIVIAVGALITFVTGHITSKKLKELESKEN